MEDEPIKCHPPFNFPTLKRFTLNIPRTPKIMDELVTPIKVELPSNEILNDKLHLSAPDNANLPSRQVRKWAVLCVIIPRRRRPRCDSNAQPTD